MHNFQTACHSPPHEISNSIVHFVSSQFENKIKIEIAECTRFCVCIMWRSVCCDADLAKNKIKLINRHIQITKLQCKIQIEISSFQVVISIVIPERRHNFHHSRINIPPILNRQQDGADGQQPRQSGMFDWKKPAARPGNLS